MRSGTTRRVRAVIFDLDGTLVDSAPGIAAVFNRLMADRTQRTLSVEAIAGMVGDGAARLVERGLDALGLSLPAAELPALVDRYMALLEASPPAPEDLYPEVAETLLRLAETGLALAVCTNKPLAATRTALAAMGIESRFRSVIGGDSLPRRKPSPDPLLYAAAEMESDTAETVMVGDHANDINAARAAGMPSIAVGYGYSKVPVTSLGADRVVDRFGALPEVLAQLATGD